MTRPPGRARPEIAAISASLRAKSQIPKFSAIRDGVTVLGIAT